jgi:hypothetical protein
MDGKIIIEYYKHLIINDNITDFFDEIIKSFI